MVFYHATWSESMINSNTRSNSDVEAILMLKQFWCWKCDCLPNWVSGFSITIDNIPCKGANSTRGYSVKNLVTYYDPNMFENLMYNKQARVLEVSMQWNTFLWDLQNKWDNVTVTVFTLALNSTSILIIWGCIAIC